MVQNNLDYFCAEYGMEIAKCAKCKSDETTIQKSLGVIQEDGLFAFILYLESKNDACIRKKIAQLLNKVELTQNANEKNLRKNIQEITRNLDGMFLAKDLIEKTLVYARYHAKALKDEEE